MTVIIHNMTLRRRVIHGWAFRAHTDDAVLCIRQFLADGNIANLILTPYYATAQRIAEEEQ